MKKYQIIYADPPWAFKNWDNNSAQRYVGFKYPVLELKDICDLPIKNLADKNCALFIWVTMPKLNEVFGVLS